MGSISGWVMRTLHVTVVVVQSLSCVQIFATPRTAARQASLSFTISQGLLKLMSVVSVMPANHLILCCPLLLSWGKKRNQNPQKSKNEVIFWSVGGEDLVFYGGDTVQPITLHKLDNQFHKYGKFFVFFLRGVGWLLSGITFSLHLWNCFLLPFLPFEGIPCKNLSPLKEQKHPASSIPISSHCVSLGKWSSLWEPEFPYLHREALPGNSSDTNSYWAALFWRLSGRMSLKTLEPTGARSRPANNISAACLGDFSQVPLCLPVKH